MCGGCREMKTMAHIAKIATSSLLRHFLRSVLGLRRLPGLWSEGCATSQGRHVSEYYICLPVTGQVSIMDTHRYLFCGMQSFDPPSFEWHSFPLS